MPVITGGNIITGAHVRVFPNAGAPLSGSTNGTLAGAAPAGSLLRDTTNNVLYINEGTQASPYWTPVNFNQRGLLGYHTDFRDGVGKAVADTAASVTLAGSGIRVFGQGIADTDSGLTIAEVAEVGPVASLLTTNEAAHLAALGIGDSTSMWQPDVQGAMNVEAVVSMDTALTDRALFIGFLGTLADALDPAVTGATVTITLVQDDLAGLLMDSGLTDAAGLMAVHNKSNEAATLAVTDTGVDTGSDVPAAGTYVRLRVEISAAGVMTCFADKVEIASIAASLDDDEECGPVLYVESNAAAIKQLDVKEFAAWTQRV